MNKNLTISRDNIYVGKVLMPSNIYLDNVFGQLKPSRYDSLRSMLFIPNEQKRAQDLLYQSPNYPILNMTEDQTVLELTESILVVDSYNLAPLLRYFEYEQELTLTQIKEIRKIFFSGRFAKDNCELFGMKECQPEDYSFFENWTELVDRKKRQRKIIMKMIDQWLGYRSFYGPIESPLAHEYFNILDNFGDDDWRDWLRGFYEKGDMFQPDKKEGPIKKISFYR